MRRFKNAEYRSRTAVRLLGALVFLSGPAFAEPLGPGVVNATATMLINSTGIFFSNLINTGPDTGSFAGTTSIIQNDLPGTPTQIYNIPDWVTLNGPASGPFELTLVALNPGFGTLGPCFENVPYTKCTPYVDSPLTLVQGSDGQVALTFNGGSGFVYNATGRVAGLFINIASQNHIPGTMTDILTAIYSPDGFTDSVSIEYQATFLVPEPLTFFTTAVGLVGLYIFFRHRKKPVGAGEPY